MTIKSSQFFEFMGKRPNEMNRDELLRAMDAFAELNAKYYYNEFCTYRNGELVRTTKEPNDGQ